ncbi:unnamed protein product [Didymodactylos carnosus]|uniref:Elongation of very long chain fatty acids protein n=1 Tax=Didymodactylos carnosus TaxID=1234261 RepID=A0A813NMJ8_9BILA|nr:unnamed protein product [Didymodactylos carnosus]CAF0741849.1 unnamed protein product [Didymodactylos carnosus]CAF3508991.1 unnamed protein product [Didymodactylos carnosus]CAF3520252.1 unnamed protein product [Didymodactylos carnosus]
MDANDARNFPKAPPLVFDPTLDPFSNPILAETVNRPSYDLTNSIPRGSLRFAEQSFPPTRESSNDKHEISLQGSKRRPGDTSSVRLATANQKDEKISQAFSSSSGLGISPSLTNEYHFDANEDKLETMTLQRRDTINALKNLVDMRKTIDVDQLDTALKNLSEELEHLEIESERAQRITTHYESQLLNSKLIGEKLSLFCAACRSAIVLGLNIRYSSYDMTSNELENLTKYAPDSSFVPDGALSSLLDTQSTTDHEQIKLEYNRRVQYSRLASSYLKRADRLRIQLRTLSELLTKSVLPQNERYHEIEKSPRLPTRLFEESPLYDKYIYEISPINTISVIKQYIHVRCIRGQLKRNDINIICAENPRHLLHQATYDASEKYSHTYDIHFKRVITSIDQLIIALPCFQIPPSQHSSTQQQKIYIRCKQILEPLINIPAIAQNHDETSYAVFRITHALSEISVEAVLLYPFDILNVFNEVYTHEPTSIFRIETEKNVFLRPPKVRIIPFNSELIRCLQSHQKTDSVELLAVSDLIEFQWFKEEKSEQQVFINVQLTRNFSLFSESDDDFIKRRRKAQGKISYLRKKFEQEKLDDTSSLPSTPTTSSGVTNMATISQMGLSKSTDTSKLTSFKWRLEGFSNTNAPIIILGYKNRKWKNFNNIATIRSTNDKDVYTIGLLQLIDRMVLIRCWSDENQKLDKLAENLWLLASAKLFCCVLAHDPNNITRYALCIVPIQKQKLAEDWLERRNYTERMYDEIRLGQSQYQSMQHTFSDKSTDVRKYVQFCLSEGTYVSIVPAGNIDVHEKTELSFRLHAQFPVIAEFDIYPIDIYRQKTDVDFIGTLNIYMIQTHSTTLRSASMTNVITSRSSSRSSQELETPEQQTNFTPPTSVHDDDKDGKINGVKKDPGAMARSAFERLITRDLNNANFVCAIRIRLPKIAFQLPQTQSKPVQINIQPQKLSDFFIGVVNALNEGKREFAEALNIHPALMHEIYEQEKSSKRKDYVEATAQSKSQICLEGETLLKWLKRQNIVTRTSSITAMTILNEWLKERFPKYRYALTQADPRTQSWFLLWNDPSSIIFLTICYLLFVTVGPRIMRKREPIRVPSSLLIAYNLGLVILSLYMLEEIVVGVYQSGYSMVCQKLNVSRKPSEMKVISALWIYFVSKAIEYMDTVFMIIRKRFTQVTFLHCFHHSTMLIIWWIVMTWIPGGQSWFGPTLNCLVHVMMYAYYGLSVIPSLRDKLWWKKYITLSQLIQFGFIFTHTMQEYITRSNERKRSKLQSKTDDDQKTTSRQKNGYGAASSSTQVKKQNGVIDYQHGHRE